MTGRRSASVLEPDEPRRQLGVVQRLALVDAVLLAVLATCSLLDLHVAVSIIGALHGGFFLTLVAFGAQDRLWTWWFPAAIVVSGGAMGALVGERVVARRLSAQG